MMRYVKCKAFTPPPRSPSHREAHFMLLFLRGPFLAYWIAFDTVAQPAPLASATNHRPHSKPRRAAQGTPGAT
jgi:hypothetical protein